MARGGYPRSLIGPTTRYIERLRRRRMEPSLAALSLSAFVAEDRAAGTLTYIDPYDPVHRQNVALVTCGAGRGAAAPWQTDYLLAGKAGSGATGERRSG